MEIVNNIQTMYVPMYTGIYSDIISIVTRLYLYLFLHHLKLEAEFTPTYLLSLPPPLLDFLVPSPIVRNTAPIILSLFRLSRLSGSHVHFPPARNSYPSLPDTFFIFITFI